MGPVLFPQGNFAIWRSPQGKRILIPFLRESSICSNKSKLLAQMDPCQWNWNRKGDVPAHVPECAALLGSIHPPHTLFQSLPAIPQSILMEFTCYDVHELPALACGIVQGQAFPLMLLTYALSQHVCNSLHNRIVL